VVNLTLYYVNILWELTYCREWNTFFEARTSSRSTSHKASSSTAVFPVYLFLNFLPYSSIFRLGNLLTCCSHLKIILPIRHFLYYKHWEKPPKYVRESTLKSDTYKQEVRYIIAVRTWTVARSLERKAGIRPARMILSGFLASVVSLSISSAQRERNLLWIWGVKCLPTVTTTIPLPSTVPSRFS
jgi:hypothetical protein